jgi:prolyl-tRNA synthetase
VARLIAEALRTAGVRVTVDDRVDVGFGRRATAWELKGVPVRIELGPRDLENEEATVVRRDEPGKATVGLSALTGHVTGLLGAIQTAMLEAARARRDERTVDAGGVAEAIDAAATGFALMAEGVTVRCLQGPDGDVAVSDDEPGSVATVARSY